MLKPMLKPMLKTPQFLALILISILLLPAFACPAVQTDARNSAAALQGALQAAQTKYQTQCVAAPTGPACVTINKAIAGQNALITATEAYCSWNPLSPPVNPTTAQCIPVKGAQAGLEAAIGNANLFIVQLKGIL